MQRKHYKLLAEAFARVRHSVGDSELAKDLQHSLIDEIEDEVCLVLSHDNPAFSYQRFTDASGRRD